MITLILLLTLGADTCGRKEGSAQCVGIEKREDGLFHGRASCYTKTNKDGGYDPHSITCVSNTYDGCRAQLDDKVKRGCKD